MRLRHIEVFHAVYTSASISNAAKVLNVSQPSVSKVLKHAEDQLGYQLFERIKGKLIPTKEAHRLHSEVAKVYTHLHSLKRLSENLGHPSGGVIRVAVTPALGLNIIPKAVASFLENHPGTRFDLETAHLSEVLSSLNEGKIDLGIVFDPPAYPNIRDYELGKGEFVCLAPMGTLLPEDEKMSLRDIEAADFIKLNGRGPLGRLLTQQIETSGVQFNTVANVETYHMAKALVELGAGVSIVDEITARSSSETEIQIKRIQPAAKFQIKAVTLESDPISLECQNFIAHSRKVITDFIAQPF